MKLSIIIPVFNEEQTIHVLLSKVNSVVMEGVSKEIIICDDGSSDNSFKLIQTFQSGHPDASINVLRNESNSGKGAAIIKCIAAVSGDYVIIQDADLEYEPSDYAHLIQPILSGQADVVYGNRFHGHQETKRQYLIHFLANKFLTYLSNLLTGFRLQDMECCYKVIPAELLKNIRLKETAFGFEPEITAALSKIKGLRIAEVPVRYYGRKYHEGKKIGFTDGLRAIYCILKYNLCS